MLKIIKEKKRYTVKDYYIEFIRKDDPESGFCFPADPEGNLLVSGMSDCALRNYYTCLNSPTLFDGPKFTIDERTVVDDPVAECHCGEHFTLVSSYLGACMCPKCGQWYNAFGQMLLDPSEWED